MSIDRYSNESSAYKNTKGFILPTNNILDISKFIFPLTIIKNNKFIYHLKIAINQDGTVASGGNHTVMLINNFDEVHEISDNTGVRIVGPYISLLMQRKDLTKNIVMLFLC